MSKGVSIVSNNQLIDSVKGISIINNTPVDLVKGISVVNNNNLYVEICNELNVPIVADLNISGGLNVDGNYSGFTEYPLTSGSGVGIIFEASAAGHATNQVIADVNEFGDVTVKIVLQSTTLTFNCDTVAKNADGVTISRIISGGHIEVTFSASASFDPDLYSFTFNAYALGSSKYATLNLTGVETDRTSDTISFRFNAVESSDSYCYIPNISNKQC